MILGDSMVAVMERLMVVAWVLVCSEMVLDSRVISGVRNYCRWWND
jgi:hypothetical protein